MRQKIVAVITATSLILAFLFFIAGMDEEQDIEMEYNSLMWFIIVD